MPDKKNEEQSWKEYRERELRAALPILKELGFELEKEQPHIGGERYLMQALTTASGRKLILLGSRKKDGQRVVIKITSDHGGKRELQHEHKRRQAIGKIDFAYQLFPFPEEILFKEQNGFVISIQIFLEQKCPFLERPTKEQFTLVLKAFKIQESAHATTYAHQKFIRKTFGERTAIDYLHTFETFKTAIALSLSKDENLKELLEKAHQFLNDNAETIEQYSGFLTQTDFVPHNFRIVDDNVYLLDHSSMRFGNKYEGWARFINFMTLYNPELEKALLKYISDNRAPEELLSLRLMRIYRLGEIICYYTNTLPKSDGALLTLNYARIDFWNEVLRAALDDRSMSPTVIETYKKTRDSLRSKEEKKRQIGLH